MRISKSIDFPKILLYLLLSLFAFFLAQVGDFHEPFSLALCFGMASANLSPILCAIGRKGVNPPRGCCRSDIPIGGIGRNGSVVRFSLGGRACPLHGEGD